MQGKRSSSVKSPVSPNKIIQPIITAFHAVPPNSLSAVGMEPAQITVLPFTWMFVSPHSKSQRVQGVLGATAK